MKFFFYFVLKITTVYPFLFQNWGQAFFLIDPEKFWNGGVGDPGIDQGLGNVCNKAGRGGGRSTEN